MAKRVEQELRKSLMRAAYRRSNEQVSPLSHVVGFWILLAGAAMLFAASAFLPMWQEQQEVLAARARVEQRLDGLRTELERFQAVARALRDDPIINEHAALLDLNYHVPGQEIIPTAPEAMVNTASSVAEASEPAHPPNSWLFYLPENWRTIDAWAKWISQPRVKLGMLLLAAFLVSVALVLFAPPAPRPGRPPLVDPSALT